MTNIQENLEKKLKEFGGDKAKFDAWMFENRAKGGKKSPGPFKKDRKLAKRASILGLRKRYEKQSAKTDI